jgi:hypothetical protein
MAIRRSFGGGDQLNVAIVGDGEGNPGNEGLEQATLRVPDGTTILTWELVKPVPLESGALAWITLSATLPNSDIALCSAHEILWNSKAVLIGESIDESDWHVFPTSGYGVRVLGRV